ncbi:MAG: hypothetical protein NTZ78_05380 [Candidatus Aureabacteria bacterium]|nr:hypothetical protein [Candidatus Auribacterota bacterium]
MRRSLLLILPLIAFAACMCGCGVADNTAIGKGVKTYEKYSDDLGKERDVNVMGKDMIIEPEADKKIRINF